MDYLKDVYFTLEFNEKQQAFHLNDGKYPKDNLGWQIIVSNCTIKEHDIFMAYLKSLQENNLTVKKLKKIANKSKIFDKELKELGLKIKYNGYAEIID